VEWLGWSQLILKVSHYKLLETLSKEYKLTHGCLRLLNNYLSERKQIIAYNNGLFTDWVSVTSGLPQGSVLGPLLFVMLLTNLDSISKSSCMLIDADDVRLLHHISEENAD